MNSISIVKATVDPTSVIYVALENVTFAAIQEKSMPAIQSLMSDIAQNNMEQSGPITYIYYGASADEEKPFNLDVAVPVVSISDYSGANQCKTLPAVDCIAHDYKGKIENIGKFAYNPLFAAINEQGIEVKDEVREQYQVWEGVESEHNQVHIQVVC